jgi:peroxiredoxin
MRACTWTGRLAVLSVCALIALGCYPSPLENAESAEFRLPTLDGRRLGPPDLAGQNVVVVFWASWCGPCRVQERILTGFYEENRHRGTEILAVNLGEGEETVREFLRRHPVPFPVLLDPDQALGNRYGVIALPSLFIVDRHGDIVYSRQGLVSASQLEKALPRS